MERPFQYTINEVGARREFPCVGNVMAEHEVDEAQKGEKILEKSMFSGIAVPIAIVLVGALIIFGVTKMLSSEKSYRDLVAELHSKTFGNRWVAAYELSKHIASNSIPKSDIPWLHENLAAVYDQTVDARTRNFIILALGALRYEGAASTLIKAIEDEDEQVRFNAVVSLGNLPEGVSLDWSPVINTLSHEDIGMKQVAIYALANHRVPEAEVLLAPYLQSQEVTLRYAAAIALANYKNPLALSGLDHIAAMSSSENVDHKLNSAERVGLKLSVIEVVKKNNWKQALDILQKLAKDSENIRVSTNAKEALNILKN